MFGFFSEKVEELQNETRQLVTPLKAQEKEVDPLECAKNNEKRHMKWRKEQEEKLQRRRDEELNANKRRKSVLNKNEKRLKKKNSERKRNR